MKKPTLAEVKDVLLKLQSQDREAYFFEQLKNPEWLEPLQKARVFARSPEPIARGKNLYFPPWPPAKYLRNIAKERPKEVAAIVRTINTNNPSVQADLVDVMLELPASIAAELSPMAKPWIEQRLFTRLPINLTSLAEYLLRNGQTRAGTRLAHRLLRVEPRERTVAHPLFDRPDAVGIISDWYYSLALEKISAAFLESAPLSGLKLLAGILSDALNIERRVIKNDPLDASVPDDYSSAWMKDIDKDPKSNDVKQIVAYRLLEAARMTADKNLATPDEIFSIVRRRRSAIFFRIMLRLIVRLNDFQSAASMLTSLEFWKQPGIEPERALIAKAFLSRLDGDEFNAAMLNLRSAVPTDLFVNWYKQMHGTEPSKDEVEDFFRRRLLEVYAPIAGELRGPTKREYEGLKAELGEPSDEDADDEVWVGPTSPKSLQELEAMQPREILRLLRDWIPAAGWREHSPEGLGRVLQPLVARHSAAYLELGPEISALLPVYIRNILVALNEAVKAHAITDWAPLIELIESVMKRTSKPAPSGFENLDFFEADRDWDGVRHRIGLILEDALGNESLPIAYAHRVWAVLKDLSNDSDPTPESEAKRSSNDPANAALNSVRGAAMIGVVRFVLWASERRQNSEALQDCWQSAFDVLNTHLNPDVDQSIAVRSVYGQYLPWLQKANEPWLIANVPRIFPSEPHQAKLRRAAWITYLIFCPIYQKTYEALKEIYDEEVRNVEQAVPTDQYLLTARQHLATHVWMVYARGHSELDDPEGLIHVFLDRAPVDIKESLVSSIGRALQSDTTMTAEAVLRLRLLWETLVTQVVTMAQEEKVRVLRAFGWWFSAPVLDERWAIEQLARVLNETTGRVDPEFQVITRLAELSSEYPLETISLLKQMATALEPFHLMNIRDHAGPIMENAVAAGGLAAITAAEVHTLLSNQGMRDFRKFFEHA